MAAPPAPAWKFWHPLPFWQVLLVALACQLVCTIPVVALQELAGIRLNGAGVGAAGGFLMVVVIRALAKRKLERTTVR